MHKPYFACKLQVLYHMYRLSNKRYKHAKNPSIKYNIG